MKTRHEKYTPLIDRYNLQYIDEVILSYFTPLNLEKVLHSFNSNQKLFEFLDLKISFNKAYQASFALLPKPSKYELENNFVKLKRYVSLGELPFNKIKESDISAESKYNTQSQIEINEDEFFSLCPNESLSESQIKEIVLLQATHEYWESKKFLQILLQNQQNSYAVRLINYFFQAGIENCTVPLNEKVITELSLQNLLYLVQRGGHYNSLGNDVSKNIPCIEGDFEVTNAHSDYSSMLIASLNEDIHKLKIFVDHYPEEIRLTGTTLSKIFKEYNGTCNLSNVVTAKWKLMLLAPEWKYDAADKKQLNLYIDTQMENIRTLKECYEHYQKWMQIGFLQRADKKHFYNKFFHSNLYPSVKVYFITKLQEKALQILAKSKEKLYSKELLSAYNELLNSDLFSEEHNHKGVKKIFIHQLKNEIDYLQQFIHRI